MTTERNENLTLWIDGTGYWTGSLECTSRTLYALSAENLLARARVFVDEHHYDVAPGSVKILTRLRLTGLDAVDLSCLKLDGHTVGDPLGSAHLSTARDAIEAIARQMLPIDADTLARWSGMSNADVEGILKAAQAAK